MYKNLKRSIAVLFVLMLMLSSFITAFAADKLLINSEAEVSVGDTITYSLYLDDCTEPVQGIQMYIYYDEDYLAIDPDSVTFDKFEDAVYNTDKTGYMTFNWTNVANMADFSNKSLMISLDFEAIKGGSADITIFVQELYGDDMTYLKAYTMTYSITLNGEELISDAAPLINTDSGVADNRQGAFINYEDGMGEENSPNQDNHQYVTGDVEAGTQYVTEVVEVTNTIDVTGDNSNTLIFVIIGVVVVVAAIIIVLILRMKSSKPAHSADLSGEKPTPQIAAENNNDNSCDEDVAANILTSDENYTDSDNSEFEEE